MTPSDALLLAQQVEKLGIIGILALIAILLGVSTHYFRKGLIDAHRQIAKLRQMLLIVKLAADAAGAKYNLHQIGDLDKEIGT